MGNPVSGLSWAFCISEAPSLCCEAAFDLKHFVKSRICQAGLSTRKVKASALCRVLANTNRCFPHGNVVF